METKQQFPTYGDIYSIYKSKIFQKSRKKKRSTIPKLLGVLFETYPDFKRCVTEKSLSNKRLEKRLIKILRLKEKYHLIKKKNFFETPNSNSSTNVSVPGQNKDVDQLAANKSQGHLKESHSQKEQDVIARKYCVANIWSGYPTLGSIYSTSKLESVKKLKEAKKEFIPLMLKILIQKYPRVKILLTEMHLSDDYVKGIFLYILKKAETFEQNFCKEEKRTFFKTFFNSEIISNILIEFAHNKETYNDLIVNNDNQNECIILDKYEVDTKNNSLSDINENNNTIDHQFDVVPESVKPTIPSETIKMHLHQYLKTLKSKYACIQNELVKKGNLEKSLEKKLNYLLNKQKKFKQRIKKYRKEIIEYDSFKSICES